LEKHAAIVEERLIELRTAAEGYRRLSRIGAEHGGSAYASKLVNHDWCASVVVDGKLRRGNGKTLPLAVDDLQNALMRLK
jgi:hypothetical protein